MTRTEQRPAWMVRQEHGALGEARTRALLLERFWVLERSLDLEGADLIIQRRLAGRSLLDPVPPRLGFVQCKYFSAIETTQYVHREYVADPTGTARQEFFLVAHTGTADRAASYLLGAEDIVAHFKEAPPGHSYEGRYVLRGRDVLVQRFQILHVESILRRIEAALEHADFHKNRAFFSWAMPSYSNQERPIVPEYTESIDNWWGDIPKAFVELRRTAAAARQQLNEVADKLREVEDSDDPETALSIAEEIDGYWGGRVSFEERMFDEDFYRTVQHHRRRYTELHSSGLLQAHAALRSQVLATISSDLPPRMPMQRHEVYILRCQYDATSLLKPAVSVRIASVATTWPDFVKEISATWDDIPDTRGILSSAPGEVEAYVLPGRYSYSIYKDGRFVEDPRPWHEKLDGVADGCASALLQRVLELRFGDL